MRARSSVNLFLDVFKTDFLLNRNDLCEDIAKIVFYYLIIIITAVRIIRNPKLKAEKRPTY